MSLNIYLHLRNSLHAAISKAFTDIFVEPETIPLFFKSPIPWQDLNTPLAHRIACLKKTDTFNTARTIMSFFEWDENYIDPDPFLHHTIISGFITFRTSNSYQYRVLNETAGIQFIDYEETTGKEHSADLQNLMNSLSSLLKHAQRLSFSNNVMEKSQFDLLCTNSEYLLIRLLAISQTEDLYSSNAAVFFITKIARILNNYLYTIPIFSSNNDITLARTILLKACYTRLNSLLKKTIS